ncbi:MAG: transporter permease [Marmoricola sp.]|nr:transporter permease [Marmoricola sp.]
MRVVEMACSTNGSGVLPAVETLPAPSASARRLASSPSVVAVLSTVRAFGEFFAFCLEVARGLVRRPFQIREFLLQAWFISTVSILPTALVAIPFGAVVALQVGSLSSQLGAQSFTGASSVVAIVREGAPLATALLLAGGAGSAICADFGARTIREEIDALKVMGVDPVARLVAPRVLASMLVAVMLTGLVMGVGIAGGYFFNVELQGGTPGVYVDSFRSLATVPDIMTSLLKGLIFGALAGLIGSFKGLRAGGGPRGVGQAVNEAVVTTFLALFLVNYAISMSYSQLFPRG